MVGARVLLHPRLSTLYSNLFALVVGLIAPLIGHVAPLVSFIALEARLVALIVGILALHAGLGAPVASVFTLVGEPIAPLVSIVPLLSELIAPRVSPIALSQIPSPTLPGPGRVILIAHEGSPEAAGACSPARHGAADALRVEPTSSTETQSTAVPPLRRARTLAPGAPLDPLV